ncbi:MAG: aspartyl-tRNA synthetase, aspartyl-tRNA synthetase [Candidatus Parcubacteria bacterium]|jgi:aspartyl-tRNA synthetase
MSIIETTNLIGQEVNIVGWVDTKRDHGKIAFIDLRDRTAKVQVVLVPSSLDEVSKSLMSEIRPEWVLKIRGLVKARPDRLINPDLATGTIEIEALGIEVLNTALTPIFPLDQDKNEISEELRIQYRYLDLRRPEMYDNLLKRHKINQLVRNFLDKEGFLEVETPILTKSTPEGARDFIVPSRHQVGSFYALPQSPQQYKQLLMAGGVERYFQIARCFRDEDTRKDRQPEFTQLDMEMSFVSEEDIMALNEKLLIELVQTLYPEKKIQSIPFPRISYAEAMEKYGNDRPDIREDKEDNDLLAFCWIVDFPQFEKTEEGNWTFSHNPFSAPKPEYMENLMATQDIENIISTQYDIVLNGFEIGGGSIRNHKPEALRKVLEIIGYEGEIVDKSFGHILTALASGTPPHGGIAWGMDRLLAVLQNESSIREVIAFPKTGDAQDPMMQSPSSVSIEQLVELGISIKKQ